jgi:hypothetical protein
VSTGRASDCLKALVSADVVRAEPGTCALIEGLLEAHAGVNAEQQCSHGDRPSCRFRLTA